MRLVNNIVNRVMFPGTRSSYDGASFEELIWIPFNETCKIPAILIPYLRGSIYFIIYAHGNGTDLGDIILRLENLSGAVQAHVLAFDYPGYGCFKGTADMECIDQIMIKVVDFVQQQFTWPLENIILYGCSIGTGPCTRFARNIANKTEKTLNLHVGGRSMTSNLPPLPNVKSCSISHVTTSCLGGLILQCPYRSIRHAAERFIGGLMSRLFVESLWNIEEEVQQCRCPILWIHGKKDELFHWEGSKAMYDKYINNEKLLKTPETATHLLFNFEQDIVFPIKEFLTSMVSRHSLPLPFFSQSLHLSNERLRPPPLSCPIPSCPTNFCTKISDVLVKPCRTDLKTPREATVIQRNHILDHFQRYSMHTSQCGTFQYDPDTLFPDFSSDLSPLQVNTSSKHPSPDALWERKVALLEPHTAGNLSKSSLPFQRILPIPKPSAPQPLFYTCHRETFSLPLNENRALIHSLPTKPTWGFSLFKHVWPLGSFALYIQGSILSLCYILLREIIDRGLHYLFQDPLFKVVDWVKRFYCIRCRHVMGIDLVYKKTNKNEGDSTYTLYGLVIMGRLIQISNASQVRGCVYVDAVPFPLTQDFGIAFSKQTPSHVYLDPDCLVLPIYSPRSDFIFRLSSWLILFLSLLDEEKVTLDTFNEEIFFNILLKNSEEYKPLEHLAESLLEDFCKQSRRPYIEKLVFQLGNYICFGWDQFLGIIFDKNWMWFRPRLCLCLPLLKKKAFHSASTNKAETFTTTVDPSNGTFLQSQWIQVRGWNMLRNWCMENKFSHGIYLSTLASLISGSRNGKNTQQTVVKMPPHCSAAKQRSTPSHVFQSKHIMYKKSITKMNSLIPPGSGQKSSPCRSVAPLVTKTSTVHSEITFEDVRQELLCSLNFLAQSLREATLRFLPPQDMDENVLNHDSSEHHLRKKYNYLNLLYSVGNITPKKPSSDGISCNTLGWARQIGALFLYDSDFFCSPTLHLLNDTLWIETSKEWINFLLPPSVSDLPTDQLETTKLITQDRIHYVRRCKEFDHHVTRKSTRYSICYHHLFHFILTQPGRYFSTDVYSSIDSFWRLIETMTGIHCGPIVDSDVGSPRQEPRYETSGFFLPYNGPSRVNAAIMINVTIGLMLLRRLYNLIQLCSRRTFSTISFSELSAFSSLHSSFPGLIHPHIRLFDELRFMLLRYEKTQNNVTKHLIVRHGGYPHKTTGWDSGCYSGTQASLLATQVETLYSFFIEILEAIDLNHVSASIAPPHAEYPSAKNPYSLGVTTSSPHNKSGLCFSSKTSKMTDGWWSDGFTWTSLFPSHPLTSSQEEPKPVFPSDLSTTTSSKTDIFESPVFSNQANEISPSHHHHYKKRSTSDSSSVESISICSGFREHYKDIKNQWIMMLYSLKAKRKYKASRLRKSVKNLISPSYHFSS